MYTIFIKELSVFTQIGIYEWEQKIKQKLLIDIKINYTNKLQKTKNKIKYFIDYSKISKTLIKNIESKKYYLIEDVAEESANIILKNFQCLTVTIKVFKPSAIAQAKKVGIIIKKQNKK